MARTFEKAGFTPGIMGEGVWRPRRGINVATVQTIQARLKEGHPKRDLTLALLSLFELVIGEEAHEAAGGGYYDVMRKCTNAHYRLALTATPFMKDDDESNMRLQAAFGSVGIEITEKSLIDAGILANPTFKIAQVKPPLLLRRGTGWPTCYDIGVVENEARNAYICDEAQRAAKHKLPTLILVLRQKHGELLAKRLTAMGVKARFVFGKHEEDDRRAAMNDLGSGKLEVLIGSNIFDVGVDMPAVGMIILAGAGKAEVGMRQRIGRGLREKKGWNECFVLDFEDAGNKHLHGHAQTRRAILESTPGFAERILPLGTDFPYHTVK